MKKREWTLAQVLALIITVGFVLVLLGGVTSKLLEEGIDWGKYEEDELPTDLFDFFEALSGRKSPYKKEIRSLQRTGLLVALAVCIPCAVVAASAGKKHGHVGLLMGGGTMAGLITLTALLVLHFYSFDGSPKVAILVTFFLGALILAALSWVTSRRLGLYALAVLGFGLALGFLLAIFLAQIVGLAAVILQELFWVAVVLLTLGSGGGPLVIYVYVIRW